MQASKANKKKEKKRESCHKFVAHMFITYAVKKREKATFEKGAFAIHSFIHGEPVMPISESLAIIELSSHSSGEEISESGFSQG